MEYEFGMKFKLGASDTNTNALLERLAEAGCDDAVVGIGQPGRIALDFTREAATVKQAIISALKDVKRAVPDAELIEVTPDFVGLTDVAELVGVTRQNMRKLMLTHRTRHLRAGSGVGSRTLSAGPKPTGYRARSVDVLKEQRGIDPAA